MFRLWKPKQEQNQEQKQKQKITEVDKKLQKLKKLTDRELLREAQELIQTTTKLEKNDKISEADILLQVLATRKLTPKKKQEYHEIAKLFRKQTGLLTMDSSYNGEFVGLKLFPNQKHPSHVYGAAIHRVWKRWKRSSHHLSFSEYFQKYATNSEFADAEQNQIRYLTESEQAKKVVTFVNGKIRKPNKKPFVRGKYMFLLDTDLKKEEKRLMIARKDRGRFHHSSLNGGRACLSAGMIHFHKKGEIRKITLDSGHFKPSSRHGQVLKEFLAEQDKLGKVALGLRIRTHKQ